MFKLDLNTLFDLNSYLSNTSIDIPLKSKNNILKVYYSNSVFIIANQFIKNNQLLQSINEKEQSNNYDDLFKYTSIRTKNKNYYKQNLTIDFAIELFNSLDIDGIIYNEENIDKNELTYYDLLNNDDDGLDTKKGNELLERIKKLKQLKKESE